MMQKELDKKKSQYDWGPDVETLPEMSRSDFDRKVQDGASLLIVDGVVPTSRRLWTNILQVEVFEVHFGKDATKSFNGGIYNRFAARHIGSSSCGSIRGVMCVCVSMCLVCCYCICYCNTRRKKSNDIVYISYLYTKKYNHSFTLSSKSPKFAHPSISSSSSPPVGSSSEICI